MSNRHLLASNILKHLSQEKSTLYQQSVALYEEIYYNSVGADHLREMLSGDYFALVRPWQPPSGEAYRDAQMVDNLHDFSRRRAGKC